MFHLKASTLDEVDEGDDIDPELAELDNLSTRSSACDCPAHLHDRETPLYIDKVITHCSTLIGPAPPRLCSDWLRS